MVVLSAIASSPDEMGCTLDSSCLKIFHGTRVLKGQQQRRTPLDLCIESIAHPLTLYSRVTELWPVELCLSLRNLPRIEAHPIVASLALSSPTEPRVASPSACLSDCLAIDPLRGQVQRLHLTILVWLAHKPQEAAEGFPVHWAFYCALLPACLPAGLSCHPGNRLQNSRVNVQLFCSQI